MEAATVVAHEAWAPSAPGARTLGSGPLYCLVPPVLESTLLEPLVGHFASNAEVEVIVERRHGERRRDCDRRLEARPSAEEQRRVRNISGRRVGEQRAILEATVPLRLPRAAMRFAGRLSFVRRIAPSAVQVSDLEDLRLVTQLQSGSDGAFEAIYGRYLSRLHVYAQAALHDRHEAEDVAHEVLITMLEAVPEYEIRGIPFRIWVFRVLRNHVRAQLAKKRRMVVEDPLAMNTRIEAAPASIPALDRHLFERIAEKDFMERIERLSTAQRQVLVLRFLLGFELPEIAQLLGLSRNAAANLQFRGLGELRTRAVPGTEELSSARYAIQRLRAWGGIAQGRRAALHAFSW